MRREMKTVNRYERPTSIEELAAKQGIKGPIESPDQLRANVLRSDESSEDVIRFVSDLRQSGSAAA